MQITTEPGFIEVEFESIYTETIDGRLLFTCLLAVVLLFVFVLRCVPRGQATRAPGSLFDYIVYALFPLWCYSWEFPDQAIITLF